MIRITLRLEDGLYAGFEAKGHALFAPHGRDIVCAAVSALTTTCVNALETVAGVRAEAAVTDGKMKVSLPRDAGHDAQVILAAMVQGLRDIAQQYPEHLQLIENSRIGGSKPC